MVKRSLTIVLILLQLTVYTPAARGEYENIYHYYLNGGIEAFLDENIEDAFFYFKVANAIDPDAQAPHRYLNLIKRAQEGRLDLKVATPSSTIIEKIPVVKEQSGSLDPQKLAKTPASASTQAPSEPSLTVEDRDQGLIKESAADPAIGVVMMPSGDVSSSSAARQGPMSQTDKALVKPVDASVHAASSKQPLLKSARPAAQEKVDIGKESEKIRMNDILKQTQPEKIAILEKNISSRSIGGFDHEDGSEHPDIVEQPVAISKVDVKKVLEKKPTPAAKSAPVVPSVTTQDKEDQRIVTIITEQPTQEQQTIIEESKSVEQTIKEETQAISARPEIIVPEKPSEQLPVKAYTAISPPQDASVIHLRENDELKLDDALLVLQPSAVLELEIDKPVIMTGRNIARYLTVNEDYLEVSRINKDQIRIKAVRRGTTIFHVWDDRGRWTFNVRTMYSSELRGVEQKKAQLDLARPFRVEYSSNWNTNYRGADIGDLQRQTLTFTNWVSIAGDTPYGQFDSFARFNKFAESSELVGQGIGLSNGRIGPFKDFTIRGYDSHKSLSVLTLPGRYFRGVLLDAYAFDRNIFYSYFRGQDQYISIYSTTQGPLELKSYIEGFKLTLNPDDATNYSLNYVRAFGEARAPGLKDEVYSVQTKQKIQGVDLKAELAHDRTDFAFLSNAAFGKNDFLYNVNFRNMQKGFQTIYGAPIYDSQVGGLINVQGKIKEYDASAYLDIYRDSALPNPDNPDGVNIDLSTSLSRDLGDNSSWSGAAGYLNAAQTISPRQSMQISNNYSRVFRLQNNRYLTAYVGQGFQWSRYDNAPTSDYDRFSLRAGFRVNLLKNLFYVFNYEHIWVRDVLTDTRTNPKALNMGLNTSFNITDQLSMGIDLSYRNEMDAESTFSFLAGEDSVGTSLSLNYSPLSDVRVFLDGQMRRVWPESSLLDPYDELSINAGLRAGWDLPFRWSPAGTISGIIYKDLNANGLQDKEEPGIEGIKVVAGRFESVTDENGEYRIKARAKKVNVTLDFKTIPQGFVFSTALSRDVVIEHNKDTKVNFGLSTRSGIYGIVYLDENNSGKPDRGDKFFAGVVVRLDDSEITKSDPSGSYFFDNIKPGRHRIKIDVTSIPIEYTPTIRVQEDIDLKEGITYVYNVPLRKTAPKK